MSHFMDAVPPDQWFLSVTIYGFLLRIRLTKEGIIIPKRSYNF